MAEVCVICRIPIEDPGPEGGVAVRCPECQGMRHPECRITTTCDCGTAWVGKAEFPIKRTTPDPGRTIDFGGKSDGPVISFGGTPSPAPEEGTRVPDRIVWNPPPLPTPSALPIAGIRARMFARLIDDVLHLISMVILFIGFASADVDHMKSWGLKVALIGFLMSLALTVIQIFMIAMRGQSIGKWAMGIQIVALDNHPAGWYRGVLLRGGVAGALSITGVFPIIDAVWIFGEERRCLHDLIAGTKVVSV